MRRLAQSGMIAEFRAPFCNPARVLPVQSLPLHQNFFMPKPALPLAALLTTLPILFSPMFGMAQAQSGTVHSSNGYDVQILVTDLDLVVPFGNMCFWGYLYQVQVTYQVTFTGSNLPASLSTLQGTVGCGPNALFFNIPNGQSSGTVLTAVAWRSATDCATATLGLLGCNTVRIEIQGPGIPHQTITLGSSTLPITLVDFRATPESGQVRLDWATASEKDNAYFTVERSADAMAFEPLLQLPGAGNSTAMLHYAAVDDAPLPGLSYYRLRQTDIDGTTVEFPVVVVQNTAAGTFAVHPNPCSGASWELPYNSVGQQLEVRSATGALLHVMPVQSTTVEGLALSPGAYVLVLTDLRSGVQRHCRLLKL